MRKVLTFGITQEQHDTIKEAFTDQYDVVDVTESFTDLLAVPADAIIIGPSAMNEKEALMFDEVFRHDMDTSIIFTRDDHIVSNYLYMIEDNPETMESTIRELQERFNLPDELKDAYEYRDEVLAGITAAKEVDEELSLRSQIAAIYNSCIPYEKLNQIMNHIPELKPKEKYPYRSEFNMVLDAFMLSQKIIGPEDTDYSDENGEIDRQWIQSLAESVKRHLRNRKLARRAVYGPIYKKIISWIAYDEAAPKTEYGKDREKHDKFRSENDLDCILRGGDLHADTVFSLWTPLRLAIVRLNDGDYDRIKAITKTEQIQKNVGFLERLLVDENLEKLLPEDNETTKLLSELFDYGQQGENTMLLPDRRLNSKRSGLPFYDYMPYFLYECFSGGKFSKAFKDDDDLAGWIIREKLECFFKDDRIEKENIIDLAGSGDIKNGIPEDLNVMLRNYIEILQRRDRYWQDGNR